MNIVIIETYPLLYKLNQPYGDANGYKKYRSLYLIRVITASGIEGWGECADDLHMLEAGFHSRIIPYLIGKSAWQRNEITETVAKWHQRAAAAVSMALTEIAAKAAGIHLCDLWGGRRRDVVPVYASLQSYTASDRWRELSLKHVEDALRQGFSLIKVKIGGRTFCEDKQHIVDIQAAFGSRMRLILDCNQSYDAAQTRKWCSLFPYWENIEWLEEPIAFHLTEEYRLLRQIMNVPIAGGENVTGASGWLPLLRNRALEILQPDPMHHPSLDAYRESLSLARQYGFRVSPHCYDGALSRVYAIFAQACLAPWSKMDGAMIEPVEWDVMDNPFTRLFALEPLQGKVSLPDGAGLGIELDMERIQAYRWDGSRYEA